MTSPFAVAANLTVSRRFLRGCCLVGRGHPHALLAAADALGHHELPVSSFAFTHSVSRTAFRLSSFQFASSGRAGR